MLSAVTLRGLTIRYGARCAVDGVDADIPSGAVGLLGRNGAGKTSILKALLGLVVPVAGSLRIAGVPDGVSPLEARRFVGYMPEKDCFVPGLNGFETVRLAAELSGLPSREASRRAHEVLYLVGIAESRYRAVAGYSTGMRQKIKLATALVHDPRILFLDEPTNGLDPDGRREMLDLIGGLARGLGKSIVLSSHILPDVERVCSDIVVLEQGRVVAAGTVAELTRSAARVYDVDASGTEVDVALRPLAPIEIERHARGGWRVTLPEGVGPRQIFAAIAEQGGALHRLIERRSSLAEVFLGAVGAGPAGDGRAEPGA